MGTMTRGSRAAARSLLALGVLVAAAVAMPAATAAAVPAVVRADGAVIRGWTQLALGTVQSERLGDAAAARLYAMVDVAMFDAVNGLAHHGYEPALVAPTHDAKGDPVAAAATAAHDVLVGLVPTRATDYDVRLAHDLAGVRAPGQVSARSALGRRGRRRGAGRTSRRRVRRHRDPAARVRRWRVPRVVERPAPARPPVRHRRPARLPGRRTAGARQRGVCRRIRRRPPRRRRPDRRPRRPGHVPLLAARQWHRPAARRLDAGRHLGVRGTGPVHCSSRPGSSRSRAWRSPTPSRRRSRRSSSSTRGGPRRPSWRPATTATTPRRPTPGWRPRGGTSGTPEHWSGHSSFSAAGAAVLAGFFCEDGVPFTLTSGGAERSFPSFSSAAAEAGRSRGPRRAALRVQQPGRPRSGAGGRRRGPGHGPPAGRRRRPCVPGLTRRRGVRLLR